jgi:hypothetical protein
MALQFNVVNPEGVEGQVGVNDIVQQLQGSGEQILGVSADGSTIKMQDATGEFEAKTEDVLKDLGWQIQRAAPINPNYSAVNSDWRQAITMLPADDHKRAYLEGQFKKAGMGNVNIVGTGRDWYAFDPESNQYLALTNNPEWDSSDVREGLVTAPRVAGSVIGGAAGAVMGGGANPLTGAVGAGLGGGAADALTRAYGASRDPLLKEIMTGDMGAMAKDVGINAGLDALTQGAFLGIPKVAGALAPELGQGVKSFLQSGPLSTAAKAVGGFAEEGGRIVNKAASVVDRPIGREVTAAFIPIAGEASAGGMALQLPGQAVRGFARGIGALGESQTMQKIAPGIAQKMQQGSRQLLRPRERMTSNFSNEVSKSADEMGRWLGGDVPQTGPRVASTEDIMGNMGEALGMSGSQRELNRQRFMESYKMARQYGIKAKDAKFIAEEASERAVPQAAKNMREVGRKVGRGVQNLENFGRGVEKIGTGIASGALKGVRAGSYGVGKGGWGVKNLGKLGAPIENKLYMRYGAEEMLDPQISPSDPWQRRRNRDKLGVILADR